MWSDLFDDIFGGGSGGSGSEGGGAGRGSFAQYGLSVYASQVPYIGQYLGFYLAGHEDLSDLTAFPSGGPQSSDDWDDGSVRHRPFGANDVDANTPGSDHRYRKEFGIDDVGEQNLLRNPNLLAENSVPKVTVESWMTAPTMASWGGQEIQLDLGDPPHAQSPPRSPPGPIDEVIVRGVRPDRSIPSKPPPLPNPTRHAPYSAPPDSRPELQAPRRGETTAPAEQWTKEVIVTAEPPPFDREESDPEALALAEGRGRIEWGDLVQLARGGYNGLVSAGQQLARFGVQGVAGPGLAPILSPILSPYAEESIREADKYKLSIDPRYGGGGIIGEQLAENLAFEALPLAPQLGKLANKVLRSERFAVPAFWFLGAGGPGGSSRVRRALRLAARERGPASRLISMSEQAAGFRSVNNPSITYVHLADEPALTHRPWGQYQVDVTGSRMESVIGIVDKNGKLIGTRKLDTSLHGLRGKVPEAKHGNMGQLYDPDWYEHFVGQSHFLIDFSKSAGRPGVQYLVSSELGANRLITVFTHLHPEHLRSGFLNVSWFPWY